MIIIMSLYIITHKYVENLIDKDGYEYLYVGAYKEKNRNEQYLYDDQNDEISNKNGNYCELTGLYWIWKNSKEPYKGLVHYRRFFTKNSLSTKSKYFYTESEMKKILKKFDIIVGEKLYVPEKNIYDDYVKYHYKKDIDNLKKVIEENFSEYNEAFNIVFSRNYYSPCNMMFCKAELFDSYCEWLFNVLNKLEEVTDITNYNSEQSRIYGFIAERLLNVWIEKKKLNKKELPLIQLDSRVRLRIRKKIDRIMKKSVRSKYKYKK